MTNNNKVIRHAFRLLALPAVLSASLAASGQNTGGQTAKVYDEGSCFYCGYACVKKGDHYLYIDSTGKEVFDTILNGQLSSLRQRYDTSSDEGTESESRLPDDYLMIAKQGKLGILTMDGKMLLPPVYDSIDFRPGTSWKLKKGDKKSIFTAKAGIMLPFKFDEVWNMDGTYYNVVQGGKWGVYNRTTDKLVIPCIYEDMDYCYGCEAKGDYVFAKKNGKWGVVDLQNKVLLDFDYDHQHMQMRSDEWVFCLLKDGVPRSINLKTGENRPVSNARAPEDQTEKMAGGYIRKEKDGKWGMLNSAGKLIYDYQYDFIRYDSDEVDGYYLPAPYVALRKDDRCGVGDTAGNIIIPVVHSDWVFNIDSFFVGRKDGLDILYNAKGKQVIAGGFESIDEKSLSFHRRKSARKIILLKKGGKYGMYNGATGVFTPPKYDDIIVGLQMDWTDSVYAAIRMNTADGQYKQGLLDIRTGKELLPAVYTTFNTSDKDHENIVVCDDSLYGVFNLKAGRFTIPVTSGYISLLELPKLIKVQTGGHMGLTDPATGEIICPPVYDDIYLINPKRYLLVKDTADRHPYVIFNNEDLSLHPLPYKEVGFNYSKDVLVVSTDNEGDTSRHAMLYDPLSFRVLEGDYSKGGYPAAIGAFYQGRASFLKNGKYGFLDTRGRVIQPPVYDLVSGFSDGLALVMQLSKTSGSGDKYYTYGVLDTTGKLLVPVKYDFIQNATTEDYFGNSDFINLYQLKERQSEVSEAKAVGNKGDILNNYVVSSSIYSDADLYYLGLAKKDGTVILPPVYDRILFQRDGAYILVKKHNLFGVFDLNGRQILPVNFDDLLLNQSVVYESKSVFDFPLLIKKENKTPAGKGDRSNQKTDNSPASWQYLDRYGKPLSHFNIMVKGPMAYLPQNARGLF